MIVDGPSTGDFYSFLRLLMMGGDAKIADFIVPSRKQAEGSHL